jgi:hypothetical protein
MLKPLLRTLPTLSGNIKIACELTDIEKIDEQNSQAYVRYAKLLPISSGLAQHRCEVSLLKSSYEFDIKDFYNYYSDIFFDDCFEVNKTDYEKINKYNTINQRNTDFEFGCKRVSFEKNGTQFAFYAPIYIESVNDLPDYFLLTINLKNEIYAATRTIKINIARNGKVKNNYLYSYLKRYAEKIDNNIIYCLPTTQQAAYHGINLTRGGFIRVIDNLISKIYNKQLTINNFDTTITTGWKRNKICMKQILPLSFYFNINEILSDNDRTKFANTKATITGAYYKNGKEVKFYNIDTDYTLLKQDVLQFNEITGIIDYVRGKDNILDVNYPSLNECNFVKYLYSNKVSPMYNRWKLKYSSDERPYLTNMSFGFSHNQNSIYKYGEFPETYEQLTIVADNDNNVILPLYDATKTESSPYYQNYGLLDNYKTIMNKYASTWFDVISDIDTYKLVHLNNPVDIIDDVEYFKYENGIYEKISPIELAKIKTRLGLPLYNPNHLSIVDVYVKDTLWYNHNWTDVTDDKTYYKGILYDLSNIYKSIANVKHIDKFGVFVKLNFNPIEKSMLKNIKSAKYSIFNSDKYITNKNCFVSQTVPINFSSGDFDNNVSSFFISEGTAIKEELNYKSLFIEETDAHKDGDFIDLLNYGFNYYNVNRYYKLSEINYIFSDPKCAFPYVFEELVDKTLNSQQYFIDGFELLPIYRLSEVFDDNQSLLFENEKKTKGEWITKVLHFSHNGNLYKNLYDAKSLEEMYKDYGDTEFSVPLYIKDIFISYSSLRTIFYENLTKEVADVTAMPYIKLLTEYEFNPIVEYHDNVIAKNVFVRRDTFTGRTYGDSIPTADLVADKNVIYVDPYNINNIIENYNSRFGTSIPVFDKLGSEKIDEKNSCEFFAKFLNEFHLKYYFNTLYNNIDLTEDPCFALKSIYIKKRLILNKYDSKNLFIKDEYTPLTDFYIINLSKIIKDVHVKYGDYESWQSSVNVGTQFEEILKNCLSEDLYNIIVESETTFNVRINDMYRKDLGTLLSNIVEDSEYKAKYETEMYNMASSDLMSDIVYNKEGYWTFSERFNELQDVDKIVGIPELNETYESTFKFELVYKKTFIKVNENIWKMINLDEVKNLPYKDLYLYVIEEPESYPKSLQFYYTDDLSKLNTTYETTACLTPLFNDIFLQNMKETAVYVEYNKNNVTPTTYLYSQSQYGKYYKYDAPNINVMYDISNYPEDWYPIVGHDIYTGETTYYFSKSYIDKYHMTGANVLTTYNLLDNCSSYISKANTSVAEEENYITYSYTDYSNPQIGTSVTYSYYTANMFNRIYPEIDGHRSIETYSYIDDITSPRYGQYTVYTSVSYEYYPEYVETGIRYCYNVREYDDIGAYDKFKLSSYIVPYTYTYSYVTTTEVTEKYVDPEGKWMSYEVTYLVETDAIGYATAYSTYGFFLIDANIDNTGSSFNVVDKEYRQKKYFTYINENYIYGYNYSLNDMFGSILPFTQLQLLETLFSDNQLVMKPIIYNIDTHYRQTPLYDTTGKQYAYDIILQNKSLGTLSHERYMDAIVPYIKETTVIENAYSLKFKEVDAAFNVSYNNSTIYNDKLGIYRYSPVHIYNTDNSYELYYPTEYKYFNDNVLINLEEVIEIPVSDSLTYDEVLQNEEEHVVITAFTNYINYNQKNTYSEDEILFLYNRYNVKYETVCVGLNSKRTEKLYSLRYKFTLL